MVTASVFTANIVVEHLDLLREAARRADVDYELGGTFTFTSHSEYEYEFRPVFCLTKEAALGLQAAYSALIAGARDVPRPGLDSLVILGRG